MKKLFILVVLAVTINSALNAQTVSLNGRQYIFIDNQWYQLGNGRQYRVDNSVITVKFREDALSQDIASLIESKGVQSIRTNILGFVDLKIPENADPLSIVQDFLKSDIVEIAEPNTFGEIFGQPNDPKFSDQWYHKNSNDYDIDSPEAWDIETGSPSVIIAILDVGLDIFHEDLKGNIWVNPGEDLDGDGVVWDTDDINGVDDDGNGYVDDIVGWDFDLNINNIEGGGGAITHGAQVAGVSAALTNNGKGVAGVAGGWGTSSPGAKLMNLVVGDILPSSFAVDDAILYAAANGADIINMSLGSEFNAQVMEDAVEYAFDNGVLVVT
ncbi:MAG: S8 family serine peptidase, partial [Candidatus Marinimicrobia bacterium]|nr:S8 family serine peptidase [Candidatus Neomarinimicrobiota bacterium]